MTVTLATTLLALLVSLTQAPNHGVLSSRSVSFSVEVVNADGAPVPGVEVRVSGSVIRSAPNGGVSFSRPRRTATADPVDTCGAWRVTFDAAPDLHSVEVELDAPGHGAWRSVRRSVARLDGAHLGRVVLQPEASLRVFLVDLDGALLVDGWSVVLTLEGSGADPRRAPIDQALGACRFERLPSGVARVDAFGPGGLRALPVSVALVPGGSHELEVVRSHDEPQRADDVRHLAELPVLSTSVVSLALGASDEHGRSFLDFDADVHGRRDDVPVARVRHVAARSVGPPLVGALVPGTYEVVFRAEGYAAHVAAVDATAGGSRHAVHAELVPTFVTRGRVIDAAGRPCAGVAVHATRGDQVGAAAPKSGRDALMRMGQALRNKGAAAPSAPVRTATAITDADGVFVHTGLTSNVHTFDVELEGHSTALTVGLPPPDSEAPLELRVAERVVAPVRPR